MFGWTNKISHRQFKVNTIRVTQFQLIKVKNIAITAQFKTVQIFSFIIFLLQYQELYKGRKYNFPLYLSKQHKFSYFPF